VRELAARIQAHPSLNTGRQCFPSGEKTRGSLGHALQIFVLDVLPLTQIFQQTQRGTQNTRASLEHVLQVFVLDNLPLIQLCQQALCDSGSLGYVLQVYVLDAVVNDGSGHR